MPPSGKGSAHTREVSRRRPALAGHSTHARIRMSTSPSSPERLLSLAVTTSFRATMLSTLVSFRMRAGSATWPGELSVTKARRTASRFLLLRSSLLSAASMVATMSTKPRLVEPRHAPGTGRSSISAGTTARRRAQCWDTWHLRFSQLSPPAATFSTVLRSAVGIARSGASAVPCDVWRGEGNTRRTGHSHTATPETREDENAPAIESCQGHPYAFNTNAPATPPLRRDATLPKPPDVFKRPSTKRSASAGAIATSSSPGVVFDGSFLSRCIL